MTESYVKHVDKGWNSIMHNLREAESFVARVGYPQNGTVTQGTNNPKAEGAQDMYELVHIALTQEFGTKDGRIPARPFFTTSFIEHQDELKKLREAFWLRILQGRMSGKEGVTALGLSLRDKIKDSITIWNDPGNAESTIARKGADNPLIDTGTLLNSTQVEVVRS